MLSLQGQTPYLNLRGKNTNGEDRLDKHGVDHTLMISTQDNTLLQTVIASVSSINNFNNYENVPMVFDNCSQKSFINSYL